MRTQTDGNFDVYKICTEIESLEENRLIMGRFLISNVVMGAVSGYLMAIALYVTAGVNYMPSAIVFTLINTAILYSASKKAKVQISELENQLQKLNSYKQEARVA